MAKKNIVQPEEAIVSLNQAELGALIIVIEQRIRATEKIKDIKGLCGIHDKIESALTTFQIPF